MKINKNEHIKLVDVDGTLVLDNWKDYPEARWLDIKYYDSTRRVVAHLELIKLVKSYKSRGFFVRVHSNNGFEWAAEVCRRLCLETYVDEVESKPTGHVDNETSADKIIGAHVFIEPKGDL